MLWIGIDFDADPDLNPTFHFDADPDPDLVRNVEKSKFFLDFYSQQCK